MVSCSSPNVSNATAQSHAAAGTQIQMVERLSTGLSAKIIVKVGGRPVESYGRPNLWYSVGSEFTSLTGQTMSCLATFSGMPPDFTSIW